VSALADRLSALLKSDQGIGIELFALGVFSRLPFRSQLLYHWDSVNFALAIEHFDIRLHQPHPPGTFVIYVMLGRLFNWFLHDPNTSLVWISILTSGLSAVLIFVLGRRWFDRRVGLAAALLMLTSPLIWFHGEIALAYMPEFFWVILVVMLCFGFFQGNDKAFLASALCLGLGFLVSTMGCFGVQAQAAYPQDPYCVGRDGRWCCSLGHSHDCDVRWFCCILGHNAGMEQPASREIKRRRCTHLHGAFWSVYTVCSGVCSGAYLMGIISALAWFETFIA
jgi:hypothetical protein